MSETPTLKWIGYIAIAGRDLKTHYPAHAKSTARLTKGKPDLRSNEVAVKIQIELPFTLFQKPSLV